jgi:hypothetical protein
MIKRLTPPLVWETGRSIVWTGKKIVQAAGRMHQALNVCCTAIIKSLTNKDSEARILCYHYVARRYRDDGWNGNVSAWKFFWDMFMLRKKDIVYLDEFDYRQNNQVVISFDDGYKNFLQYAFPILKFFRYKFELFIIGDYYISDTISERSKVRECMTKSDLEQILKTSKGRLQYHSKTHYHLAHDIDCEQILEDEIKLPSILRQLDSSIMGGGGGGIHQAGKP